MQRHTTSFATSAFVRLLICYALFFTATPLAPLGASPGVAPTGSARVTTAPRAAAAQTAAPWRERQLLVRFRPDADEQAVNALVASQGLARGKVLRGASRVERITLATGQDPKAVAALLSQSPLVEFAEPNFLVKGDQAAPDDPRFPDQWALFNPNVSGSDIGITRLWAVSRGSRSTVVAVVDSGVDFTHPDLTANRWVNARETSETEDADGDGYAGDRHGWDFVTNSPAVADASGHGTAVAGIIAAEGNNARGITGVMWSAGLMSLRVLDSANTGDVASAVEAIDYAVAHGASVVNCSWGTDAPSAALKDAVERAGRRGVLVVASAGNDAQDIDSAGHYPASFELSNLVSVAATDNNDSLAPFSNWGARVTVAAPGVRILSTKMGGDYDFVSGTSAAAPLVAGAAGLFRSLNRSLTAAQLKSALASGARQVPALSDRVSSGGVVSASLTLDAVGRMLEESRDRQHGGGNAGNAVGGGIGNGNAERNSVPPSPPSRRPATPNLPNLDDVRARKHELPHVPDPVPSRRFSPGDGPRGRRASNILLPPDDASSARPTLLARLSGYSLADLASSLRLSLRLPATDYYHAYGTSDSTPALKLTAAADPAANAAPLPRLGTEVSNAPTLAHLFAFQAPAYGAAFAGQSVPTSMIAGRPYQVSVTMTNTGTNTWTATDMYRLGEIDNGPWSGRVHLTQAVAYGASVTFNFTVVAPSTPGTYNFQWQMVRDGVTWFGAATDNVAVAVSSAGSGGAPTSGLVGYWRFDEGSGATASDSSGAGNTGTLANGPTWAAGAAGSALSFDGADDYVQVGARPSLAMSGALTVSAWVNPAGDGIIVNKENEYEIAVMGGHVQWAFNNASPGWAWIDTGVVPPQGQWTHVTVTYDNGTVKTYSNGALAHTYAGAGALPAGANEFRIGGRACCPQFFSGRLDEVRVYNRALSASEAGTLPNGGGSDTVWVEDSVPTGATPYGDGEGWSWISSAPAPVSGSLAHQSAAAAGEHQHYFAGATQQLTPAAGEKLIAYVYLDPANVPSEVMLQWNDGAWEHRAYWGANQIAWGTDGTDSRRYMGSLPQAGQWTRLEVPAESVGLAGHSLQGMAFTLYGGRATWDHAGKAAGGSGGNLPVLSLDPLARVGEPSEDMLSRNFNWSIPLVGLKGRAGLDLGLSLSYNSLVWRRDGSTMIFDEDRGDPTPGFRLGFPVIRGPFTDTNVGLQAYLLVLPSGRRVELQQLAGTNTYESIDSSYLRLTDAGGGLLYLRSPDGTQLQYYPYGGLFRCTQILDRNGNYISISYNTAGNVSTVNDTLNRSIVFQYDAYNKPLSITQMWWREYLIGGMTQSVQELHTWATFGYSDLTVQTNYPGLALSGIQNGQTVPVLTQVGLTDGTRYNFDYNPYAQIYRITRSTYDGSNVWTARSYTQYNLPLDASVAQSDCPRFTQRRDWAAYWNGDADGVPATNEEVVTSFSPWDPSGSEGDVTTPDGTTYKEFYGTSGWQRGLTTSTEYWSGGQKKKWTTTAWSVDSGSINYQRNPAPYQMDVYDAEGNHRTTAVNYTYYGLPDELYESGPSGLIRRTHTDYNLSPVYTDRRIIGLVSGRQLYEGFMGALQSKVEYLYDEGGETLAQQVSPVQHDDVNFGAGLVQGRALLTRARRYDVTNLSQYTDTVTGYNTAGSVVFTRDPAGHQTNISYADAFFNPNDPNSTVSYGTYAYPTAITDPDNYSSTAQYYYDFGGARRARDPKNSSARTYYDQIGRIERTLNEVNGGYTRFVYATNNTWVQSFSLLDPGVESYSIQAFNGLGAVRGAAAGNPNSSGGYSAQYVSYDQMGRVSGRSNQHEIDGNWVPAGDDAGGYQWVTQTYDWKGRPFVTTNTADGTTKQVTYGGCGCAGGEVTTMQDEVGRRQRTTADALGRVAVTEVLNLDGTTYSTKTNTYNVRDQVTRVYVQQGTSGAGQETLMSYDGFGRLATSKAPEQSGPTSYGYYPDDNLQSATDARGATTSYAYNNRHLVSGITYSAPAGITVPAAVSFGYDEAGNRASMTDGSGSVSYGYNTLSQMTWETKQFSGLAGSYQITYDYTVGGLLKTVNDLASGSRVDYSFDSAGRLTDVAGSGLVTAQYASSMQYRAWGALKSAAYGNGTSLSLGYNGRQALTQYSFGGVKRSEWNGQVKPEGANFEYYADGKVKFVADLYTDATNYGLHDRAYSYDHAGRLAEVYSYVEAQDFRNGTHTTVYATMPLRQSYAYDVWGNTTGRTGHFWSADDNSAYTYNSQNRNAEWEYDADGRFVSRNEPSPDGFSYQPLRDTYDAGGRLWQATQTTSRQLISGAIRTTATAKTETYDGDGLLAKEATTTQVNAGPPATSYEFYLRSTMLGGRVISKLDGAGVRQHGYVLAGGEILAEQQRQYDGTQQLTWHHTDPVTRDELSTNTQGVVVSKDAVDPAGVAMGDYDPFDTGTGGGDTEGMSQGQIEGRIAALMPSAGGGQPSCYVDGFETSCQLADSILSMGAGYEAVDADVYATVKQGDKTVFSGFVGRQQLDTSSFLGSSPIGTEAVTTVIIPADQAAQINNSPGGVRNYLSGLINGSGSQWSADSSPATASNYSEVWKDATVAISMTVTANAGYFDTGQQNPTPEERAANRAADTLRNNTDCSNFISELIYEASHRAVQTGSLITPSFEPLLGPNGTLQPSYGPDYGINEYRSAISEGRVTASGRSGTSGNTVTYGTTTNYSTISWNREFYSLSLNDQALQTLHESLHLIPNFSDFALADAAHMLATRNNRSPGTPGNFASQSAASQYLNEQIARHCR